MSTADASTALGDDSMSVRPRAVTVAGIASIALGLLAVLGGIALIVLGIATFLREPPDMEFAALDLVVSFAGAALLVTAAFTAAGGVLLLRGSTIARTSLTVAAVLGALVASGLATMALMPYEHAIGPYRIAGVSAVIAVGLALVGVVVAMWRRSSTSWLESRRDPRSAMRPGGPTRSHRPGTVSAGGITALTIGAAAAFGLLIALTMNTQLLGDSAGSPYLTKQAVTGITVDSAGLLLAGSLLVCGALVLAGHAAARTALVCSSVAILAGAVAVALHERLLTFDLSTALVGGVGTAVLLGMNLLLRSRAASSWFAATGRW